MLEIQLPSFTTLIVVSVSQASSSSRHLLLYVRLLLPQTCKKIRLHWRLHPVLNVVVVVTNGGKVVVVICQLGGFGTGFSAIGLFSIWLESRSGGCQLGPTWPPELSCQAGSNLCASSNWLPTQEIMLFTSIPSL